MAVSARVTAIVLAAGASTRMGGRHKLLLPIEGQPLVLRAVRAATGSACRRIVVVTGGGAERVEACLRGAGATDGDRDLRIVRNADCLEGMASSLRCGLRLVDARDDAAVVLLADMPGVGSRDVDRLLEAFDRERPRVVVPVRHGRRGNPVLWPRDRFDELMQLRGDTGARGLLPMDDPRVCAVEFDHDGIFEDVDTPAQMRRWAAPPGGTAPEG